MIEITNPARTIRRNIQASKAPKRYGDGVYKFRDEARLMAVRGWTQVRHVERDFFHGGSYWLLNAPEVQGKPPYPIDVVIPSKAQILALADELHRDGKKWADWVGEWPCMYVPAHEERVMQQMIDPVASKPIGEPSALTYQTDPRFDIGYPMVWHVSIQWKGGERRVVGAIDPLGSDRQTALTFAEPDLAERVTLAEEITETICEGTVEQILVNKYERNLNARSICLAHYGPVCVVCQFSFEEHYGRVASGYIHVHHLVPISSIGQEYELDPIRDLRPVCPNCHSVIHIRKPEPYTIDEAREFLAGAGAAGIECRS